MFETREERIYASSKSLMLFAIIYFPHYFKENSAPFHKEMCALIDGLNRNYFQYLLEIAFRESAKTSYAKIDFIRNIVFGWSKMMFYISYEENMAENNLLDIALELQKNERLISDFGQIYYDTSNEKKSRKTSVGNFLTSNGVRVQASTVKKTLRGQVFNAERPDYILMDDIENDQTKNSFAKTQTTINFIEEMMTAISPKAKVIILGNRISDTGVISNLEERFRETDNARIFEKALIENGNITWERFTWEWIEQKKALLNRNGQKRFEQEYLNQPVVDGDRLFNIEIIDSLIENAKTKKYNEPRPRWKVWKDAEFDSIEGPHEYMVGIDVSQGFGLDSSCVQVINRITGEQVAEWESNNATPNELVDEILWAYENYNYPIIAPENNSIGQAVIAILKERSMAHILYIEKKIDNITGQTMNRYGFNTNSKTKPKMIFDLQQAIKEQSLLINSVLALKELRSFTNSDIGFETFDAEASRHYDRVMALAIAWQMRNHNNSFSVSKQNNPFDKIPISSEEHRARVIDETMKRQGKADAIIQKRFGHR